MSDFNPVTQFRAEAVTRYAGKAYALAGGVWLVCTHPEIQDHGLFKTGAIYFRDYWQFYCYDDDCQAARVLRMSA